MSLAGRRSSSAFEVQNFLVKVAPDYSYCDQGDITTRQYIDHQTRDILSASFTENHGPSSEEKKGGGRGATAKEESPQVQEANRLPQLL